MSRRKRLSGGPAPAPATSGGGSRTFVETTGRRSANSALGGQAVQCSPSAWFLERLPSVWSAGSSRERRPRAALAGLDATVLLVTLSNANRMVTLLVCYRPLADQPFLLHRDAGHCWPGHIAEDVPLAIAEAVLAAMGRRRACGARRRPRPSPAATAIDVF